MGERLATACILIYFTEFAPRSARTCETGFMMAASAEIGRFTTLFRLARSMITTWGEPPELSHTVMNLSDSIDVVCAHGVAIDNVTR